MDQVPQNSLDELLERYKAGDKSAFNEIVPLLYKELHALAHHYLRGERSGHTLQTTALVHEAYMKMAAQSSLTPQNKNHLIGIAAHMMREILVDYAKMHNAAKRGHDLQVPLDENVDAAAEESADVLAIDEALKRLSKIDPQQGQIVELRYFGGRTVEETAAVLGISVATTKRDWTMAKAWLARELGRVGGADSAAVGKD